MAIAKRLNRTVSAVALSLALGVTAVVIAPTLATDALAATVSRIIVQGNRRVDADTIRGFLTIRPGEDFGAGDIDDSIRQLFNTGLFADIRVRQDGNALVVDVIEQAIVNQVLFRGNRKLSDADLAQVAQTGPRGSFDGVTVEGDVAAIERAYDQIGRNGATVSSRVETVEDGRVNVIFDVDEGDRTKIGSITFVGNSAFSDRRLRGVINTKRSSILSFLNRRDVYDEDRSGADEELLRRFYFNRGYADFQIVSTVADFDPNENEYAITVTVDEGERYTFGDINVDSTVPGLDGEDLRRQLSTRSGAVYSAEKVEDTLIALSDEVANRGFAFAEVNPRGSRDFANRTIAVDYVIDQGPRVFVERIEIRGNTRTRDYVVRREFDISEGDAFNRILVRRAQRRLEALNFFQKVNIRTVPGSDPDRIILVVEVEDQSTGEFGVGAGFQQAGDSGSGRPTFDLSVTERNLLGRGQFVRGSVSGSSEDRKYAFSFTEPYFLGRRLAAGFDISKEDAKFDDYDYEELAGTVRLTAPLTDKLSLTGFYAYKREEYDINNPSEVSPILLRDALLNDEYVTSSGGYALTYNSLDNRQDPREGLYAEFRQEVAGLGGDAQWLKSTANVRYYRPLNEEFDIIGLVRAGAGNVVNFSDDSLRTFDHFFVGPTRLRGFKSRGIGPRDASSNVDGTSASLGGTNFVNASAEVTFPMPLIPEELGLRGALFADAASIWDYRGTRVVNGVPIVVENDDFDLRASVGVSILWASPFGPLRLDYAEPVRKLDGDVVQNFNFGISSRF